MQTYIDGFEPPPHSDPFEGFSGSIDEEMAVRTARAIEIIRKYEPSEGYYLAFSGGKDSIVCRHLLDAAAVSYDPFYNLTTIDPPELVRFLKKHHPDVKWNRPEKHMLTMVAESPKVAPTRHARWCCDIYKERGGIGRFRVIGVRKAESPKRAARWGEYIDFKDGPKKSRGEYLCPIVHWSDEVLWHYIRHHKIPYCELYDQGFKRLGCVGCPLAGGDAMRKEFARWPRYEMAWKRAIRRNWEKRQGVRNHRTGELVYQNKFKSWEEYWDWWLNKTPPGDDEDDCQMENLWTNL